MEFRDSQQLKLTALITVIIASCYWIRFGFLGISPAWEVIGYCSLSGIAALLATILRSNGGVETWKRVGRLYPALLLPLFYLGARQLHHLYPSSKLSLRDFTLLRVDRQLGIAFTAWVGSKFRDWPPLAALCGMVYTSVAFWVVFGAMAGKKPRTAYWLSVMIATVAGFLAYPFVPAVGPRHLWGAEFDIRMADFFDYSRQVVLPHRTVNCMPSLHASWAMLLFWNTWNNGNKLLRVVGAVVLGATVLATLGLGEHYVVDIVVAVPFAYAIHCATNPEFSWASPQRRYPVLLGGLLFLSWELLLGTGAFDFVHTVVLQGMVLLSMAMPASQLLWRKELLNAASSRDFAGTQSDTAD